MKGDHVSKSRRSAVAATLLLGVAGCGFGSGAEPAGGDKGGAAGSSVPIPGGSDLDACRVLSAGEVTKALGAAPRRIADGSRERPNYRQNRISCVYDATSGSLTFVASRTENVAEARAALATKMRTCSAATPLRGAEFPITSATGFLCSEDHGVDGYLEWQSISLKARLTPDDGATALETSTRTEDLLKALQSKILLDSFIP